MEKNMDTILSQRNHRLMNLVQKNGLMLGRIIRQRCKDVCTTYMVELTNKNGDSFIGVNTAVRGSQRFSKMIGHQAAYGRALKQALKQFEDSYKH